MGRSPGPAPAAAPVSSLPRAYELERQGMVFYREQKYDEALKKFQAAVDVKLSDAVLLNNRVSLLSDGLPTMP